MGTTSHRLSDHCTALATQRGGDKSAALRPALSETATKSKCLSVTGLCLDTVLNRKYSELADHYGTAIVPTRVRRPQDKSHAEGSVSYASTWILAALRNETFFSLADAKEAVAEKLEELNGYAFKKREGNRRDAYIHEEKEFMQPLPANPYEPSLWLEQIGRAHV